MQQYDLDTPYVNADFAGNAELMCANKEEILLVYYEVVDDPLVCTYEFFLYDDM